MVAETRRDVPVLLTSIVYQRRSVLELRRSVLLAVTPGKYFMVWTFSGISLSYCGTFGLWYLTLDELCEETAIGCPYIFPSSALSP